MMNRRQFLITSAAGASALQAAPARWRMYVGTYTQSAGSKGIYVYNFDPATGKFESLGLAAESVNPSFLAIHPNRRFLFAVGENKTGLAQSFRIDGATGKLTFINEVTSGGPGACFISTDAKGRYVFTANYTGGSIAVIPVEQDGKLREPTTVIKHDPITRGGKQMPPLGHAIRTSPDGRYVLAADLGVDKLFVYKLDYNTGKLTPNDPPFAPLAAGAGPRHFYFHPNRRFVYVINELNMTVTAFRWDANRGALQEIETVATLPPGATGKDLSTAEILVHPSGKYLYGSNRGHNSISVFSIDQNTGKLKLLQNEPSGGGHPRNFTIHPEGKWLFVANQNSDNIVPFQLDTSTGRISRSGDPLKLGRPVCLRFMQM